MHPYRKYIKLKWFC